MQLICRSQHTFILVIVCYKYTVYRLIVCLIGSIFIINVPIKLSVNESSIRHCKTGHFDTELCPLCEIISNFVPLFKTRMNGLLSPIYGRIERYTSKWKFDQLNKSKANFFEKNSQFKFYINEQFRPRLHTSNIFSPTR